MRGREMLETIENLNPAYIEAADEMPKAEKVGRFKWASVAACLCLLMAGALIFAQNNSSTPAEEAQLPLLTITYDNAGAMGFEGYMAYDISDLTNGNPWHEGAELSTLPVYRNALSYDESYNVTGTDCDKMEAMLYDVAARLGIEEKDLTVSDDAPDASQQAAIKEKFAAVGAAVPEGYFEPSHLIGEASGIIIEVSRALTATIDFMPPIELPEEYHFAYHCSYEDMQHAAQYLQENYSSLLDMEVPKTNIYIGDYDIYQRQLFNLAFFEGDGDLAEQMVNYAFRRVAFYPDEGKLWLARVWEPDLSDKVGDYPIISVEDARTLLEGGKYITSVPYELPGMEYVAKVELMYRNGAHDEYHIPYYRFFVELPELTEDNGMKTYGAYYVPAVHESYISNMPVWDGSFN